MPIIKKIMTTSLFDRVEMSTSLVQAKKEPPLLLKSEEDVSAYLAKHLTPVRRGPKGQPIYAQKDIEKLDVRLYAES